MLLFVKWAFCNNLAAFLGCCMNSLCMFGFFFVDVLASDFVGACCDKIKSAQKSMCVRKVAERILMLVLSLMSMWLVDSAF